MAWTAPDVFRFHDYRAFLREFYAQNEAGEYGFSLRAFSKRAQLRSSNAAQRSTAPSDYQGGLIMPDAAAPNAALHARRALAAVRGRRQPTACAQRGGSVGSAASAAGMPQALDARSQRLAALLALTFPLALGACVGTRTGNPGDSSVPVGAELARSSLAHATDPQLSAADAETFGSDNRAFACALYRQLASEPGNLFFSPYSISTALAMTYAGAKGQTESEMAGALHFTLEQAALHTAFNATAYALDERKDQLVQSDPGDQTGGDGFQLNVVNQAWGRKGYHFLDSYLDVLAQNYGAGLFLVDFAQAEAARTLINDWVAMQTQSRIEDLLPMGAVGADTALVLTNAIYFKASWLTPFDPSKTASEMFAAPAGGRAVPMMHAIVDGQYAEVDGYQAVALTYLSPSVSMLVILPPEGSFELAAAAFDSQRFDALREGLGRALITLSLPKWSFESERKLKQPLRALGMQAAFEPGLADLSGMDGQPGNLYIDEVYHKAFVAVDEQGTEAAAATAVVGRTVSLPPQVEVRFDRPFLFAVFDAPTGQILFLGHVVDPS